MSYFWLSRLNPWSNQFYRILLYVSVWTYSMKWLKHNYGGILQPKIHSVSWYSHWRSFTNEKNRIYWYQNLYTNLDENIMCIGKFQDLQKDFQKLSHTQTGIKKQKWCITSTSKETHSMKRFLFLKKESTFLITLYLVLSYDEKNKFKMTNYCLKKWAELLFITWTFI